MLSAPSLLACLGLCERIPRAYVQMSLDEVQSRNALCAQLNKGSSYQMLLWSCGPGNLAPLSGLALSNIPPEMCQHLFHIHTHPCTSTPLGLLWPSAELNNSFFRCGAYCSRNVETGRGYQLCHAVLRFESLNRLRVSCSLPMAGAAMWHLPSSSGCRCLCLYQASPAATVEVIRVTPCT